MKQGVFHHLGVSWHSGLRRGTDVWAFALGGEADGRAEGILHRDRGGGHPPHGSHQLYGGQHPRGRGLEGDQVEHVLARVHIAERHLGSRGSMEDVEAKLGGVVSDVCLHDVRVISLTRVWYCPSL